MVVNTSTRAVIKITNDAVTAVVSIVQPIKVASSANELKRCRKFPKVLEAVKKVPRISPVLKQNERREGDHDKSTNDCEGCNKLEREGV